MPLLITLENITIITHLLNIHLFSIFNIVLSTIVDTENAEVQNL